MDATYRNIPSRTAATPDDDWMDSDTAPSANPPCPDEVLDGGRCNLCWHDQLHIGYPPTE